LDAETGPLKSPPETTVARRDPKGPEPIAEIPAQAAYLNLTEKYAVRRDWMVELIWTELAAPHPVVELVSALESGTEFFEAETAGRNSPILRVCRGRDRVIRTIQPACL
jgi:hypothetical protein